MAAADPGLTPAEALDILLATGECPNGAAADADGQAGCTGQGTWADDPDGVAEPLPNALRAAQAAGSPTPPPPPPPPGPTAPDPPGNLSIAKAKSATALVLKWSAPANDGGSPIASYFVYRRGPGETAFTRIDVTGPTTRTYTDTAVERRSLYAYYVTAFNSYYESAPSNEVSTRSR
jgi:hypothetical protein